MKNQLYILVAAVAAVAFCGCSKDDEGGGSNSKADEIFDVQVPEYIARTRLIPVGLSIQCDMKPEVTFATEGDAMGVVSLTETPEFDTEYIYAREPIDVVFADGTATATFWYIPLSSGNHTVTFTASYTQNGVAKTETSVHTLTVSDAFIGGFEPEVVCVLPEYYDYCFRNSPEDNKSISGCDFRIAFVSLNDATDPEANELSIGMGDNRTILQANVFCPIKPQKWNNSSQEWTNIDVLYVWIWNEELGRDSTVATGSITFELICRDNYNRCRNIIVKTDADGNVVSSEIGDYYLWRNRK